MPSMGREAREVAHSAVAEAAVDELARVLFEKMQHLDPSTDGNWGDLSVHAREFYVTCVEELALHPLALRRLLDA